MKVYIPVLYYHYERFTVLGVYSSPELAEASLDEHGYYNIQGERRRRGDRHEIASFDLNEYQEF